MNLRGIYKERATGKELIKLSEWKIVPNGGGYRTVFEKEGVADLRADSEVLAFETDNKNRLSSNDIVKIPLSFEHPTGISSMDIIEKLKEVLPENCFDQFVGKEEELSVFNYSGPWFKATDLSRKNQSKALALHPSFLLEEIDVELYVNVSIDTQLGISNIYFSNYNCTPILYGYGDEALCIDPEDPFFQEEYKRYYDALENLKWNPVSFAVSEEDVLVKEDTVSEILFKQECSPESVQSGTTTLIENATEIGIMGVDQESDYPEGLDQNSLGDLTNLTENELISSFRNLSENLQKAVLDLVVEMAVVKLK